MNKVHAHLRAGFVALVVVNLLLLFAPDMGRAVSADRFVTAWGICKYEPGCIEPPCPCFCSTDAAYECDDDGYCPQRYPELCE